MWVGKGSLLGRCSVSGTYLQYYLTVKGKKKRALIQKKVRGERGRERDVRVKLIPVDPFGMPSFFL